MSRIHVSASGEEGCVRGLTGTSDLFQFHLLISASRCQLTFLLSCVDQLVLLFFVPDDVQCRFFVFVTRDSQDHASLVSVARVVDDSFNVRCLSM